MTALQALALALVGLGGTAVVFTREPIKQAMVSGIFGVLLAIAFFLFQAPDVALSQIGVGTVALPLMILLALTRIKRDEKE